MKTRPKALTCVACVLIMVAASLPLQTMARFGAAPWELRTILSQLAPLNWVVIAFALSEAFCLYEASPWAWFMSIAFLCAVTWNNWLVATLEPGLWPALVTWAATGAVFALHGPLLSRNVRHILTHPHQRWWKTAPRRKLAADAIIYLEEEGAELFARMVDISETGVFISSPKIVLGRSPQETPSRDLALGTYCAVRLRLESGGTFACTAAVVRQSEAKGEYPSGFGLCFVDLTRQEKRELAGILRAA
jgi:hypothetical protein